MMGYQNAYDMGIQVDLAIAVWWHLQANMYPPLPFEIRGGVAMHAVEAIHAYMEGDTEWSAETPSGRVRNAQEWVEGLHLHALIDAEQYKIDHTVTQEALL